MLTGLKPTEAGRGPWAKAVETSYHNVVLRELDRFLINKGATRLLVFAGAGRIQEVSGNWTAWRATKG